DGAAEHARPDNGPHCPDGQHQRTHQQGAGLRIAQYPAVAQGRADAVGQAQGASCRATRTAAALATPPPWTWFATTDAFGRRTSAAWLQHDLGGIAQVALVLIGQL